MPRPKLKGDKLKQRRQSKDMSQSDLALLLDTHATHVSRWELGKQNPYEKCLSKMCSVLECEIKDLT